jgi:predicted CopG family antitoxin
MDKTIKISPEAYKKLVERKEVIGFSIRRQIDDLLFKSSEQRTLALWEMAGEEYKRVFESKVKK